MFLRFKPLGGPIIQLSMYIWIIIIIIFREYIHYTQLDRSLDILLAILTTDFPKIFSSSAVAKRSLSSGGHWVALETTKYTC